MSEELLSQLRDGVIPDADVTLVCVLHFINRTDRSLTVT
jgi:hypothetical protein